MNYYFQPLRMLILLTLTATSLIFTIPLAKAESKPEPTPEWIRPFASKERDRSAPNAGRQLGGSSQR